MNRDEFEKAVDALDVADLETHKAFAELGAKLTKIERERREKIAALFTVPPDTTQ